MEITSNSITLNCPESTIYNSALNLDNKRILELGCGSAQITRDIASSGSGRSIIAAEVDTSQHEKNLLITDLPNVEFVLAGAQAAPAEDNSIDVVFMFKSLHHVPEELLEKALSEIHRVLKPGGYAYLSEPIYAGDFNNLMSLFHDEKVVRENAFNTIKGSVGRGQFSLDRQLFFNTPVFFEKFSDFDEQLINTTHSDHQLSEELYQQVKSCFMKNMGPDGARFTAPIRVDLLQKS
jgi:SAM-dependent methyltransferase